MKRLRNGTDGPVGQIAVKKSSGYEVVDQSALVAVKQWKFIPARKGEVAIPVWVTSRLNFSSYERFASKIFDSFASLFLFIGSVLLRTPKYYWIQHSVFSKALGG
jgi:TonB family protein